MSEPTRDVFDGYIDEAARDIEIEERADQSRFFYLRPSSFPYCGLRKFLENVDGPSAKRVQGFSSAYYTGVGHVVHSVFQKYLGRKKRMLGDWLCKPCNKWYRHSIYTDCKECGGATDYHEIEIKDERGLAGHLDGIFVEPVEAEIWPVDYKTTSMRDVDAHAKSGKKFPHRFNVHQIIAYVVCIEYYLRVKVAGWMLVYLPRDNPFKKRVIVSGRPTEERKAKELKKILTWIKVHRLMLRTENEKQLQTLWQHKLCSSRADYFENFHDHFDKCPFVDSCFNRQMDDVMKDTLTKGLAKGSYPLIQHASPKIRKELQL